MNEHVWIQRFEEACIEIKRLKASLSDARAQAIEECAKVEVRMKENPGYRLSYRDGFVDGVAVKEAAIRALAAAPKAQQP